MHNIKKQGYNVQEIEGKEVLFRIGASENKTKTKLNVNSENLPVAIQEEYFDILFNIHCLQKAHCGQNRTADHVKQRYHNFAAKYINLFVNLCSVCNLKKKQQSQPRLQIIKTSNFLERFQVILVFSYIFSY